MKDAVAAAEKLRTKEAQARLRTEQHQVHEVHTDASRREDFLRGVAKRVLDKVESATEHRIPMLPRVAARAMQIANDPSVSIRALESVIQPDPMLMARMLSIANSPVYGAGKKISNLRTAMMMLGVGLVRDILYQSVAEAHIFRGASESYLRRQRLHGVAVAYLARDLCGQVGLDRDYAFLAGLMHDMGAVVLRQILDAEPEENVGPDASEAVIDLIHPHVGRVVCERWKLPGVVREAARRHHRYRDFDKKDGYSQIGHVLFTAERLAEHVGLGHGDYPKPLDDAGMMALFELGLDQATVDDMIARAEALKGQLG